MLPEQWLGALLADAQLQSLQGVGPLVLHHQAQDPGGAQGAP